jgi:hypothetical protein
MARTLILAMKIRTKLEDIGVVLPGDAVGFHMVDGKIVCAPEQNHTLERSTFPLAREQYEHMLEAGLAGAREWVLANTFSEPDHRTRGSL